MYVTSAEHHERNYYSSSQSMEIKDFLVFNIVIELHNIVMELHIPPNMQIQCKLHRPQDALLHDHSTTERRNS